MKVILAGAGAFGIKHLEAMSRIEGIEVVSLVGRDPKATAEVAKQWKIPHVTTELSESLAQGRRFLRGQVQTLFAAELGALDDDRAEAALASVDALTSYETYQLLTEDRGFATDEIRSVLNVSLTALLSTGGTR